MNDDRPSITELGLAAPLCTCTERGEPDWNGVHESACPWLAWSTAAPSIADLTMSLLDGGATLALLDAAPVLLEIASAALTYRRPIETEQNARDSFAALGALDAALAKVRS